MQLVVLNTQSLRHIKDPIHGHIPISPKLTRFIDTKQFQRLRNIKQLGTTGWVWPGASHTRFEHCIGVAYLARLTVSHLQKNQPELEITDRDVDCVEIAGLCHDLGHGPWSHVWDGMFIPRALPGTSWKHEQASEMMLDALIRENNIAISEEDQSFIKALIAGEHSRTPHEKAFLFDIVANKRNGLDVDKMDYIHRDSRMVGDPIHLSAIRLINSARVLDNQICYNIKDANQIYELCASRFKLHKIFYNHKAAKAIEYMIVDGLIAAEPYMKIAERIFDPNKFLYLTDDIMSRIQSSEAHELEQAREIFDRILKRDLYKCVDYKVIDWPDSEIFTNHITPKKIVESALALISVPNTPGLGPMSTEENVETSNTRLLQESDVIVDFSIMHYGMKEKNPLDSVRFYSKLKMDCSLKATRGSYSNLMPQYFAEILLRVYTKKAELIEIVQAGYRAILRDLEDQIGHLAFESDLPDQVDVDENSSRIGLQKRSMNLEPTPPVTQAPSTPKMSGSKIHSSVTYSTPFSNNEFMTVCKSTRLASHSRKLEKRKETGGEVSYDIKTNSSPTPAGSKRCREVVQGSDAKRRK